MDLYVDFFEDDIIKPKHIYTKKIKINSFLTKYLAAKKKKIWKSVNGLLSELSSESN